MWDPNETLAAWARDDDVLSWRSLDTLRGVETDHVGHDPMREDVQEDTESDDEMAEVFDTRTARFGVLQQPIAHSDKALPGQDTRVEPAVTSIALPVDRWTSPAGTKDRDKREDRPLNNQSLCELPSTSEMVSIREPMLLRERAPVTIDREVRTSERKDASDRMEDDEPTADHFARPTGVDPLQRSPHQAEPRRGTMTLGDLLAKTKLNASAVQPPPPPTSVLPTPAALSPLIDGTARLHDLRALERQCQDLAEKDRHLQAVLAKQLHQIEIMEDQLRQQDANSQSQQLELNGFREQASRLERQNTALQTSLREKEQAQEKHTQLLVQKTNELMALETKVCSLQIANESFQEQARKATEEKDKVHKDYLQVVYDLGKLQKQMNAAAKETVSVAEKDLLLREIDQLRHEKDQLAGKLKEIEARKSSLLQNNAAVEAHKVRDLQMRIRELEEDLHSARNVRPGQLPTQLSGSFPPSSQLPSRHLQGSLEGYPSASQHDPLRSSAAGMASWGHQEQSAMPSLLSGVQSNLVGAKPMTLKDMMGDRRPQPPTSSSSTSLASLGFSLADRRTGGLAHGAFDFEQFKADAIARRSTSVGDVLRQQQPIHELSDYSFSAAPDAALAAPFATEKQTLLRDSLQKRDLEQKLLKLHVEKEQMEAKLIKVEQTGLKTMSARTEKIWLDNRLRDLTLEIGRLKLSLR